MSWSILIVIVPSDQARGIGRGVLGKRWLKDFVKPELRWVHASFTAISVLCVHRIEFLKRQLALLAAWVSWLRLR